MLKTILLTLATSTALGFPERPSDFDEVARAFDGTALPLLKQYCLKCHSTEEQAGDLDLEQFTKLDQVRNAQPVWQKVVEMLDNGEMPPKKSRQLSVVQRKQLRDWARSYLDAEARANAGDPGSVLLRRLSNVEYDNTVRDLTGVDLRPAREFPVDGAAGEGFTNVGEALAMSPSMLDKYVAAAKAMASHAVLLPGGFRFSEKTTRRDWTDEIVSDIRQLYGRYTDPEGSRRVQLQGLDFQAESGGRIPLERYLKATIDYRELPSNGRKTIAAFAIENHLSAKYLQTLFDMFSSQSSSLVLEPIRTRWRTARTGDVAALAAEIRRWQGALTKFNSVAHFKPWIEAVNPLAESQTFRVKIEPPPGGGDVVLRLVTHNAGDGRDGDYVVWERPRLESPGRPELLLRDLRDGLRGLVAKQRTFAETAKYLAAADDLRSRPTTVDLAALAKEQQLDPSMLAAWCDYLGIAGVGRLAIDGLFTDRMESGGGYAFVKGWGTPATPSVVANSSDREVHIPGTMTPHSIAVHPSPTQNVAVGWRSPFRGRARVEAKVAHAHPGCGNGVSWSLELRRGSERRRLAGGEIDVGKSAKIEPIENIGVELGDLIALVVGPRGNNHACDLTSVDLMIRESVDSGRSWTLSRDVSGAILSRNPHADSLGNRDVWYFYQEKSARGNDALFSSIPRGSLLDQWREEPLKSKRILIAEQLQQLLSRGPSATKNHPDTVLYHQLTALSGPLLGKLDFGRIASETRGTDAGKAPPDDRSGAYGLPREQFGQDPSGKPIEGTSLITSSPSVLEVRVPADLAVGREFVVTASLDRQAGNEGSVQAQVAVVPTQAEPALVPGVPILVRNASAAQKRVEKSMEDFRRIFPAAVCYTQIVPVDEVVTLVLFHREDEALERLMLDEPERLRLDRLWDELRYISQDAIKVQEAYGQFMEYVTQDGDVRLFEPLRKPIRERSEALRKRLIDTEPAHLDALMTFASRAYRRPLERDEQTQLRSVYSSLRRQDLDHDAAFRLTLTRVLMAPSFLYRVERSPAGTAATPVSDWELASRLSYFLWSSMPDDELRSLAVAGQLQQPTVLAAQARRMLKDERMRALATEFGCQWLDVRGFDTFNEKSEKVFPQFAALRGAMYEESIRFFMDLFQRNGSVLEVLDADHTFVNEALARHYGIPNVKGPEWRRVDGIKSLGRGGILGMATLLSKQSGASRTSPILRGNWLVEMLLGDKLPKPPKSVPQLPESELDTHGLTMRQITERHRETASCAKCHDRIDPFGFALEGFDAIGRRRTKDLAGRPIDTKVQLKDGTQFADIAGLRDYVLGKRRYEFLHQFARKLLGYSLGRAVQLSDEPLLVEIQRSLAKNDYQIQSAIQTVIASPQFRLHRGLTSLLDQEQSHP
jgi:Protein of unknown function (DUF1592)/Protein of unknown function (DUF1588)/Protein of unknown function (DUF1587)/Protein of unknown function (DUF1585)/Protein of unknown function (DUF1595)/Planctomycete cytochrome C